jgi:hypothetical protein
VATTPLVIQTKVDLSGFQSFNVGADAVKAQTDKMAAGFQALGPAAQEAGAKVDYSLTEARHAAMGLGEEIGVHLPRVVSTFLARSETLGPILAAAFSTIAVVGLLQVLAQVPAAIEKIVSTLSGWTDEARAAYNQQIALNDKVIEENARMAISIKDFNIVGKEGSEKYGIALRNNVGDQKILAGALGDLLRQETAFKDQLDQQDTVWNKLTGWMTGASATIDDLKSRLHSVTPEVDALTAELRTMQNIKPKEIAADAGADAVKTYRAEAQAVIDGQKQIGDATEEGLEQRIRQRRELGTIGATEEAELLTNVENQKYQIQMKAAEDSIALLRTEGSEKAAEIARAQAQVIALEINHDEKLHAIQVAAAVSDKKSVEDLQDAIVAAIVKGEQRQEEAQNNALQRSIAINKQISDAAMASANQQEARIKELANLGVISKRQEGDQLIELYAREAQQVIASIQKEIDAVKAREAAILAAGNTTDSTTFQTALRQETELQNQLTQAVTQYQQKINQAAISQDQYFQKMQQGFQQIVGGPLDTFVNKVVAGQEKIGVAFQQMGLKLVQNLIDSLIKMALAWAEHWALVEVLNASGNATIQAQNMAFKSVAVLSDAKQAAANAMAVVPFPLNLIAAPAAFAATVAFGAQEGGIIPGASGQAVPMIGHAKELVLPENLSTAFQNMVASGGAAASGGATGHTFAFAPVVHAMDAEGVDRVLSKHSRTFQKHVANWFRNGVVGR